MPGNSVARAGDVAAATGSTYYSGADSGAWSAGALSSTTTSLVTSDGKQVVTKASCTFSFSGKAGNSPVTGTSTVKLEPATRRLKVAGASPLVHGDSTKDSYGNTLSVESTATLRTA